MAVFALDADLAGDAAERAAFALRVVREEGIADDRTRARGGHQTEPGFDPRIGKQD
ncbi:hypothetical protein D3C83_39100 [compost metagenome]